MIIVFLIFKLKGNVQDETMRLLRFARNDRFLMFQGGDTTLQEMRYMLREIRYVLQKKLGYVSREARSSAEVTVAVPIFPTTIPAAILARNAASNIEPPERRASAAVAMTVSPAPVMS